MECADRIATRVADRTLEPVRAMVEHEGLTAVSVRALLDRRRFDVTIRKAWLEGPGRPPVYRWAVDEVRADGDRSPEGARAQGSGSSDDAASDPEDAFWTALEAIRAELDASPA